MKFINGRWKEDDGSPLKIKKGMVFGKWTIIERDFNPTATSHSTFWLAKCGLCGEVYSVNRDSLVSNKSSCCNHCKCNAYKNRYDISIGTMFGYLEVMSEPFQIGNGSNKSVKCKCHKCNRKDLIEVRISHLLGQHHSRTISCGCAQESAGELKIRQILETNNIPFQFQYYIKNFSKYAPFDFAIFNKNNELIELIEYDGEQHFKSVEYFGGKERFKKQQEVDERKNEYCKKQGIKLIRIPYTDFDKINLSYLEIEK